MNSLLQVRMLHVQKLELGERTERGGTGMEPDERDSRRLQRMVKWCRRERERENHRRFAQKGVKR